MTKNIGLFGGAFDPVHLSHIQIVQNALESGVVDEVWALPDKEPRGKSPGATYEQRLEMLRLAFKGVPNVIVDGLQMQREGRTHDHATTLELVELYPDYNFLMILGEDAASKLHFWERPDIFCEHCQFLIVPRPDYDVRFSECLSVLAERSLKPSYIFLDDQVPARSSTEVRRKIESKLDYSDDIDQEVAAYILENTLYQ